MIRVKIKRRNSLIVFVRLTGHADYAEYGSDIVCSAATAISTCIGDGIVEIMKVKASCKADEGIIEINLQNNSEEDIKKCQVLMETMCLGLKNIEIIHSGHIKVMEEEV